METTDAPTAKKRGPLVRRPRLRAALWVSVPLLLGLVAGLGSFTFMYAEGGSYLGTSSQACANCHIMQDHFDAWEKSPHHAAAGCNDCHAPHDAFFEKWYVKGLNGFNHSLAFTTGNHPDPLAITEFNRRVTEQACRHCHAEVAHSIELSLDGGDAVACIRCHSEVGHLE